MNGNKSSGHSFLLGIGICSVFALFARAELRADDKVQTQEFTAVAAAPGEAPWIGLYRRGHDGERPTYEGRLLRLEPGTAAKAPELKSWGMGFSGERILAIIPASLAGRKGIVLILEWMVEGPMEPRLVFLSGPRKTELTELEEVSGCGELQRIRGGGNPSELALDCLTAPKGPEGAALSKRSVTVTFSAPKLGISLFAPISLPQKSARDRKLGELTLDNTRPSELLLEDSFEELSIRSADGKAIRRIAAKTVSIR